MTLVFFFILFFLNDAIASDAEDEERGEVSSILSEGLGGGSDYSGTPERALTPEYDEEEYQEIEPFIENIETPVSEEERKEAEEKVYRSLHNNYEKRIEDYMQPSRVRIEGRTNPNFWLGTNISLMEERLRTIEDTRYHSVSRHGGIDAGINGEFLRNRNIPEATAFIDTNAMASAFTQLTTNMLSNHVKADNRVISIQGRLSFPVFAVQSINQGGSQIYMATDAIVVFENIGDMTNPKRGNPITTYPLPASPNLTDQDYTQFIFHDRFQEIFSSMTK